MSNAWREREREMEIVLLERVGEGERVASSCDIWPERGEDMLN